ncbi:MAG: rhomboid family intramembrane serine protease [Dysgonomonas sp.]
MNRGGGFFSSIPVVTKNLIIINVLVWLVDLILNSKSILINGLPLYQYTGLHYFSSDLFMPHQLITYMFVHGGFSHMFFNMFAVFMFGRTLETVWGPKRFLIYYLITGIGAGLTQELVWAFQLSTPFEITYSLTVGASGAVFGILLAFGMLFPNAELMIIPIPIPIKAKYFVIGYGVLELFLGIASFSGDSVAHFAHLGGLVFGLILVLYWKKTNKTNGRFY